MLDILKKIKAAKDKFTDPIDVGMLTDWEKEATKHLIVLSLKDNKGIQILLERYIVDVRQMKELLLTASSKTLDDYSRDVLLAKKEMYERFINMFTDAEVALERLEKTVDENVAS